MRCEQCGKGYPPGIHGWIRYGQTVWLHDACEPLWTAEMRVVDSDACPDCFAEGPHECLYAPRELPEVQPWQQRVLDLIVSGEEIILIAPRRFSAPSPVEGTA